MKKVDDLTNKELYQWYICDFISDTEIGVGTAVTDCALKGDIVRFYTPDNGAYFDLSIECLRVALYSKPLSALKRRGYYDV